ncbi:EamA-like transporter family protein [Bifidobacterium bombi DSM 19703]|uniref:EamA-like transporter family protein n=2 Tax=Bifidobacterium bombi TaxID=471511 RepID=A0A080N1V4_9BIFI|nr:EamA-like transporter family protein [Bifidobacterium bombi DSM 19703]
MLPTDEREPEKNGARSGTSISGRGLSPDIARVMLLACAALWGASYLVAKDVISVIPPQWLMTIRTGGACLIMLLIFHKQIIPSLKPTIVVPALVVGATYYATMVLQTNGLRTIDSGRSAFLTASYCVLTPFAAWLALRQRPGLLNVVAAVICLIGVGLVSLKPGTSSVSLSQGDVMTLLCAVIFAINLTYLGVYSKRFNALAVTFVQFAVAFVCFLIGALFTEPRPTGAWLDAPVVTGVLYLLLGATTLGQIMQNTGLKYLSATNASILMCTESLFAQLFSSVFGGERIGGVTILGFAFIFAAVLLSVVGREAVLRLLHGYSKRKWHHWM